MTKESTTLHIAEIAYESGQVRARYARYLDPDGKRWIRHGLFVAYHENGEKSSEGLYEHGSEQGIWRDYHENGQRAAEGEYRDGVEVGTWSYWAPDGTLQGTETFPRTDDSDGVKDTDENHA